LSVSNKTGIVGFAGELVAMGWDITASPGTAKTLREAGHMVTDMSDMTHIPAILGHRVFSEHIKIAGALVADRTEEHDRDRALYDIPWFDLLCVDLYPLSNVILENKGEEEVTDATDIGGVTLIRNAVKGRRIVVTNRGDYTFVIGQLQAYGDVPENVRRGLWAGAELACAKYCLESAKYISRQQIDGFMGTRSIDLSYGENPYQADAAFYNCVSDDALSMSNFRQLAGGKPSYVNLTSLDGIVSAILRISTAFAANYGGKTPYIALGAKHGVPVGAAIDWDAPGNALKKMLWGDPRVIWGGEVISNFAISEDLAGLLFSDGNRKEIYGTGAWMLDLIAAPEFSDGSIEVLGGRERRRIFCNTALSRPEYYGGAVYRNIRGGFVRQPLPDYILRVTDMDWTGEALNGEEFDTLLLAWAIAWSLHANGIALARDRQLIGCDGQPSSVGAVQAVIRKAREAGHGTGKAIFAANAFLPFTDSVELFADNDCIGGILPKGGANEASVRGMFADRRMSVAFIPESYRGFSRH
jgi:phosphoribosylaminoimidazolecarboxamide formyltransferase / IMP cyclohydrolase